MNPPLSPSISALAWKKINEVLNAVYDNQLTHVHQLIIKNQQDKELFRNYSDEFLHAAVVRKNLAIVKLLLSLYPKEALTKSGRLGIRKHPQAALRQAIILDHIELAQHLVRAGADVNEQSSTSKWYEERCSILRLVITSDLYDPRYKELAKIVIEHGANINAVDSVQGTVLDSAIKYGRLELPKYLLSKGAQPNIANDRGQTPVHSAANRNNAKEMLLLLRSYGANVLERDNEGWNALHYLANASTHAEVIATAEMLLSWGVCVNDVNNNGYTPLDCAVYKMKIELAQFLANNGADLYVKRVIGNKYPLHIAAILNQPEMILVLLSKGANIKERNRTGRTALHKACGAEAARSVSVLMFYNYTDLNIKDHYGHTPLSLLKHKNLHSAMETFIKHIALRTDKKLPVINTDLDIIKLDGKLELYYSNCLEEIERMKGIALYDSYSFYVLLNKSPKQLALLAKNEALCAAFKNFDVKSVFPFYFEELIFRFNNAEKMRDILLLKKQQLNNAFEYRLPDLVITKIASYMVSEYIYSV